ncbi:MAG: GAF domain-containing protein, partial [Candidatus Delongbacteria bacterium]|nr:GAF domain-containing protein [Candidatus Delongbacteria bacterium]
MTKKKLKQLDNMIKEILNVSHDAIVVSNSNMEIIHVNKVAIDLFGYSENEILGIKILNLLPKRKKENYIKDEQKISEERITVSNVDSGEDFFAKKKDGTEFSIELTWVNWEGKSKNHYNIAQIRDITKRKTYQSDLEISNRALTVISECNKVIISAIDEISYFQDICNIIVANGGYISVWIALVKHDENKSIEPVAYQGYEKGFLESSGLTWELHGQKTTGPSARAVNTKKIAICNNIQSDPRYDFWSKEAKKRGYNSSISLPLIIDGNVEAVLAILSEDAYAYNNDEIKLLEQLSSDISFGIKSLRLKKAQVVIENHLKENEKKLLLSNRYLQVISQSNKSLAEANSVEEYLEDICKIIVNIGGHLKSLIQRINYRGSVTIDTLAIYGNSLGEYEEKQLLAQGVKSVGLTAICVEEKRPVVYQNIIDSGNFIYWDKDPKKIKFQSAVVIPMIKNDQVVGTLRVFSRDPFSYNNKEVELLQDLANDIAYSIDLIKSKEKRVLVENKLNESENKYKNL